MRTIREIARLHLDKRLSLRAIAGACNLSVSTVQGHVKKIEATGMDYAAINAMPDNVLNRSSSYKKTVTCYRERGKPKIQLPSTGYKRINSIALV